MRVALAAMLLAACGGAQKPADPHHRRGVSLEAAALPHEVLRGRGGAEVAPEAFAAELAAAQVVCVAESHRNPHHHWAQLVILRDAVDRGGELALGMEMFQTPFQGVVDDYVAGKIDDAALLERSGWKERWGFDWDLYSPMVHLARDKKIPVLALNAPEEIVKKVARNGLAALSAEERRSIPEVLVLDDERHRAFFREATAGHAGHGSDEGAGDEAFERFYTAQVIWDETMAEGAARWVTAAPGRRVILLAGTGHCHDTGIPSRLRRRGVSVVSVLPVLATEGAVAEALAEGASDLLFVMDPAAK